MPSQKDLAAAKRVLSARLLRAKGRRRDAAMRAPLTIGEVRDVARRNVHGLGVATKIVEGKPTRTLCVRLYVVQKLPESVLPRKARLPKSIDGVPTDVIEAPRARFHAPLCSVNRAVRQRPITGGISAAHYAVNRATLGCFCHSTRASEANLLFMLSCNHAFANTNAGARGDRILQPSPGDGGGGSPDGDVVGRLARFVRLRLDGSTPNRVDAAIAQVNSNVGVRNGICSIGRLIGTKDAIPNMKVRKHGRKTGYTEGVVTGIDFDWTLMYGTSGWALFEDQLFIEPLAPSYPKFAGPGDSGSVVVMKSKPYAVGLYFAGADDGSYGLANPISAVCSALRITIP